jgi:hypothetical protein
MAQGARLKTANHVFSQPKKRNEGLGVFEIA